MPLSGEQGKSPVVVSTGEKSIDDDEQIGSQETESSTDDAEGFQVRFYS